ncbi:hypothetical protein, partial [Methylobacterium tardum]
MTIRSTVKTALRLLPPVRRATARVDRLKSDLAHAHMALAALEAELARLQSELGAALETARDGASRLDGGQRAQTELVRDLNALTARYLAVQTELGEQQSEHLEALDREIALRERLHASEALSESASAQNAALSSDLRGALD